MPTRLFIPAVLAVVTAVIVCWRMVVGEMADRPVPDRVLDAAGLSAHLAAADFLVLERLVSAAGALASPGRGTLAIRTYYNIVRALGSLLPAICPWSHREMIVCTRYLAARIDRYLASNKACSRRVRSL